MAKRALARMVWPEAQEALERQAVVMIPLGSIEPSGRHSMMGGEQLIAEHFCDQVAARTGAIWVPTIPFGYAPSFMGFPGSITLRSETLAAVLEDTIRSLIHHGFEHIMVVDNHSGNEAVVEQVARKVRAETGLLLGNIWLPVMMRKVAEGLYENLAAVHGHGGEPGCSVRLYLAPEDMRLDLAVETQTKPYAGLKVAGTSVKEGESHWTLYLNYDETNLHGGSGVPFGADAEQGRKVLERMTEWGVQVVEKFRAVPKRGEGR